MDQITCAYTESSSSSSYENQPQNTIKSTKPYYHNSLHSVRKSQPLRKPTTKHFIAPLPPTPLKIYDVEPSKFKEVVRMLTSTPEFQNRLPAPCLQGKAPPPLIVSKQPLFPEPTLPPPRSPLPLDGAGMMSPLSTFIVSPDFRNLLNYETMQTSRVTSSIPEVDYFEGWSPEGLGLSPASFSWCSSVLFSPGTLSIPP